MSLAWETTVEDVWNVLGHYGGNHDYETICNMLNHKRVEDAALYGDDIDEQTNYAYAEIERQLRKKYILPIDADYWQNVAGLGSSGPEG